MSDSATPGWYPDPERPGSSRYWDGRAWGPAGPPAPAPLPPPGPVAPSSPRTDGFAIAALVLSVLGGLLLAVVFAFVARGRIKRSNGALTGTGLTTAALVISALWALAIAALIGLGASGLLDQENADDFDGPEREVAVVVDRFEGASAETICDDLFSAAFRARAGGDACADAFDLPMGRRAELDVGTITITGETAVATAEENGDHFTFTFVREGGEWRIDTITE